MRTAIFILALAITDIARALGHEYKWEDDTQANNIMVIIFAVFVSMDVIEFVVRIFGG